MKSFSRRLGYLHASKEAQAIVKRWLGEGGLLENVLKFNDLGKAMFENVAPVRTGRHTLGVGTRVCRSNQLRANGTSICCDPSHTSPLTLAGA